MTDLTTCPCVFFVKSDVRLFNDADVTVKELTLTTFAKGDVFIGTYNIESQVLLAVTSSGQPVRATQLNQSGFNQYFQKI